MNLEWKSFGESHIKRASSGKLNKTFVFDDNSLLFADAELFSPFSPIELAESFLASMKLKAVNEGLGKTLRVIKI